MKKIIMKTLVVTGLFLIQLGVVAQNEVEKKQESFNVEDNVSIDLNTKRTNVIIETWNRDEVEIEAKVISDELSEEQLAKIAERWKLDVMGNSNKISIHSNGTDAGFGGFPEIGDAIGSMTADMIEPLMQNMVGPMLRQMSHNPLPPQFMESVGSLNFDYEAYEKEGEAYLERYEKQIENKFGNNFDVAMETWGKNFEKEAEVWAEQLERKMKAMERSGEMKKRQDAIEKRMEEWGEDFGKRMEEWASQFEGNNGNMTKTVTTTPNGGKMVRMRYSNSNALPFSGPKEEKAKRTLVIKMPKNAKLHLNVRHGSINLEDEVVNLRGNVAHAGFVADKISGKETSLSVSYSPIKISNWEHGSINMSYVKNCEITKAKSIKLSSNASDLLIKELEETGIISGSFGTLTIENTGDKFKRLDISLENSDLVLKLPSTSFNFIYNGSKSDVKYPEKLNAKVMDSYGNQLINGYHKSRDTDSSININARFSDVVIK